MLRPVCRLHTRWAGRFYAHCEIKTLRTEAPGQARAAFRLTALFRLLPMYPCHVSARLNSPTGGRVHHIADCGGNSRKGFIVGTVGKVAHIQSTTDEGKGTQ